MSPLENNLPAPYATSHETTRGRVYPEPDDPIRDCFELDRHRIVASAAFRRLQYKTQAFVTFEDDHFRTRLTHTLEVAEVSRRLAIAVGANPDLSESIALAHDLGHSPFGHAGEKALQKLMQNHGGFEHNLHSLRTIDFLEHPYPPFRGLNLTFETREGLAKHETAFDKPDTGDEFAATGPNPTLEGQIACLADRIAYDNHDLEDAMAAGLFELDALDEITLWRESRIAAPLLGDQTFIPAIRRPILDTMLTSMLVDASEESRSRIENANLASVDDVRNASDWMITVSKSMEARMKKLEAFLFERVYRHPKLVRMDDRARRFITRLFEAYMDNPKMLPQRFGKRLAEQGEHRVVCDYIAGMTDRFCLDECKRLFDPFD